MEQAGKINIVYVLAGTSAMTNATGAKINGVDNASYKRLCEMLDISQFGVEHKKRLSGLKDTGVSISGNLDTEDTTGQLELEPGDSVYIGLYPLGTGSPGKQVPGIVELYEESYDANGKQTFSCSIQGNGAPVVLPARV